ncbi:MAG: HAD-IA family hydrolase [Clostridium sp.]|nr:HAD-IA family hydrolase [Clostridium sp.]
MTNIYTPAVECFCRRHSYLSVYPRAALIDMDGTLYDSMPNHVAAWMKLVSEIGIEATPEEFFMYEGRTGASTINILFNRAFGRDATAEEAAELYRRKTVLFAEMPPVSPMPGAAELLQFLEGARIRRVLVTGSGQNTLLDRLDTDFPGAFPADMRVTSRDVSHGKPSPEPYEKGLEKAGVTPDRAIAFENAPLGVESAARAGVFTVAVTTGPIPRLEMERAGAAIVFQSMEECAGAIPMLLDAMANYRADAY